MHNRNVIITGANRGIGNSLLRDFVKKGYNVWACTRTRSMEWEAEIHELESMHHVWIKNIYLDLKDENSIEQAAKLIHADQKEIDCLVNNAGISGTGLFMMTPIGDVKKMFQIDFFGPLYFTQLIAKKMVRQKRGSIVNIASIRGVKPEGGGIAYGTAKSALIYVTKVLAKELGAYNIRVNAVAPGLIQTDMIQYKKERIIQNIIDESALGRMGVKEDVVNAVLFLASDEASFITGEILKIDGGYGIG